MLFRDLIGLLHNLFFGGQLILHYDANVFTAPSRWGAFIILAPVVGGVIVTFLVSNFAPGGQGTWRPRGDGRDLLQGRRDPADRRSGEVAGLRRRDRQRVVGRSRRPDHSNRFGARLDSWPDYRACPPGQRITLVAAGAGAGIAATFNTPIGGVMFAIELMLPEVSVDTFLPVAIATGAATFVGRWFFGDQPAFLVPPMRGDDRRPQRQPLLVLYAVLGAVTGVAAAGFVRRPAPRSRTCSIKIPWRYARHMLGMLLRRRSDVRAVSHAWPVLRRRRRLRDDREHPVGRHVGSAGCWDCCSSARRWRPRLSLGSGSSGGIFSPSLFMGATLGGGFAALLIRAGLPIPSASRPSPWSAWAPWSAAAPAR